MPNRPLPDADVIRAQERHPGRPDLVALSVAYARARRAVNRDGAGTPGRSAPYLYYLDACEAERVARRAYFDAVAREINSTPNQTNDNA
jgi:hypothetical protein